MSLRRQLLTGFSLRWFVVMTLALGALMRGSINAGEKLKQEGKIEDFWTVHVQPLLERRCGECHNPDKHKGGLDLSSLQTILAGGNTGAAAIPGRPEVSNLYKFLLPDSDPHMPPGKRTPLSEEEIGLIKTWIQKIPVVDPANTATNAVAATVPAVPVKPRLNWTPPAGMPAPEVIDRFLEFGWKERGVRPARLADDRTFVRRVYLDLAGRIPTKAEAERFLEDNRRDRRARLVDALLASSEYPVHLREVFDVVLMGRPKMDFETQREQNHWFDFLEEAFGQNRPWNEVVRDIIVARSTNAETKGAFWYLYERQGNPQVMAEALAPVAFGVQIKCAQCHDHMVAREIKQAHYWGMVAAFNRSKNVDTPSGKGVAESAIGGFVSFANLKKESQPALLTFFNGRKVDETRPSPGEKEVDSPENYLVPPPEEKEPAKAPSVPKFSRRAALADAVTKDNPLLARAMVNRVWAMVFGRGLVHPVDLMDSKHAPSHPELLDWLEHDFERSGYDVKRLIRELMLTRAYQLDSKPAPTSRAITLMAYRHKGAPLPIAAAGGAGNPLPEAFAYALEKPLSAEQLFRSLLIATDNRPDAEGKVAGRDPKSLRESFVTHFPDLFAPDYNATLQQALFLSNSPLIDALLAPRGANTAARLLAVSDQRERVRGAFQAVFGRDPERDELAAGAEYLAGHAPEPGVRQLLWALLTGAEFQVNH